MNTSRFIVYYANQTIILRQNYVNFNVKKVENSIDGEIKQDYN